MPFHPGGLDRAEGTNDVRADITAPTSASLAHRGPFRPPWGLFAVLCALCPGSSSSGYLVAGRATRVGVAAGIALLAAGPGRCPAGGEGVPGEGGAAEVVGEVVALGLTGRLVQPERVQRLAVIGQLGRAAGAVDHAKHPGDAAGGAEGGTRRDPHREPEAQAATGAHDLPAGLLLRRVERLPGSIDQDGADPWQLPDGDHRAAAGGRPWCRAGRPRPGTATRPGAPAGH